MTRLLTWLIALAIIAGAIATGMWLIKRAVVSRNANTSTSLPNPFPVGEDRTPTAPDTPLITPGLTTASSSASVETDNTTDSTRATSGRYTRLWPGAVAALTTVGAGTSTHAVLFADRGTGNVYYIGSEGGDPVRLTNTTLPRVQGITGVTTNKGIRLAYQYLKNNRAETLLGDVIMATSTTGQAFLDQTDTTLAPLQNQSVRTTILSLAAAPDQKSLFTLEQGATGVVGMLSDVATGKQVPIFSSLLTEWRVSWPATSTIALQTKAASLVPGFLYWLDVKTKNMARVLGNIPGLTTLTSPNRQTVLYSGQGSAGLVFGLYNTAQQTYSRMPFQTWADKCVWAEDSLTAYCGVPSELATGQTYPDSWYSGEQTTSDNIWRIRVSTKQGEILFNPELANTGYPLDVGSLALDGGEGALYVLNRRDSSLWKLDLQEGF